MLDLIWEIARRRGTTVILSTHFLDEVEESCSRAIILNRGEVIAEGSLADIKRRAAPSTARLRVPPGMHDRALAALRRAPGVSAAGLVEGEGGWLVVTFDGAWLEGDRPARVNSAVRALIEAEVPVLSFELEGARLSEAFLALTAGEKR